MSMMRILLSNDDGIFAPGLVALAGALGGLGRIIIVAPESPQSAAGHSITLKGALTVRQVKAAALEGLEAFSVDGSPADCVRLAVKNLLDRPVDLVVSGMNAGSNVGVNVFYSGTVAAAAEAAMLGIPAVAMSASIENEAPFADFVAAAKLCRSVLERLLAGGLSGGDLINVNIPCPNSTDSGEKPGLEGISVVPQSTAEISDVYYDETLPSGRRTFRLADAYSFLAGQDNSDVVSLAAGNITVTPLHVDMTNHDRLTALAKWTWPQTSATDLGHDDR